MNRRNPAHISPTAHYTGFVWTRHGLSPPELATPAGRAMYWALEGPMRAASLLSGGVTLEKLLLQRHRIIDHLLERAIARGEVGQVIEVAAGLSGRGLRMTARHRELIYVEGDLPQMAEQKRARLARVPGRSPRHHVVALNALSDDGPQAIGAATEPLVDHARGAAIVTEGLLTYFPPSDVLGMWARFAGFLEHFPRGTYLSDIHLDDAMHRSATFSAMRALIAVVSRGSVHLSFGTAEAVERAVHGAGFASAVLHRPKQLAELELPRWRADDIVSVLEARTAP